MKSSALTTNGLKDSDQLASWRDWFWPAFEIAPLQFDGRFQAQNSLRNVGSLVVSHVLAPAVHVKRTKKNIQMVPADHWVLTYCRHGATTVKTPKGEFTAPEGIPFFWSFGEEFESKRTRVDRVQILLPREKFSDLAPLLDTVRGSALASPLGSLVGDYVLAIERRLSALTRSDGEHLVTTLGHMIAACAAPTAERKELAQPGILIGALGRATRIIDTELASSDLQPSTLCRRLGVSRSQLYRMFEPHGGVATYIQRRRLLRIFEALGDLENRHPIAALAAEYGFEDPSSFGRAFRREFGRSARDVRASAQANTALPAREGHQSRTSPSSFADFL